MRRREFLMSVAGAAVASGAAKLALGGNGAQKPNIVFIIADDMGYADLGCYGSKQIQTPNIDHMAAEGLRFSDCYSGCAVCAPARSVLMTGYHMGHTSVRINPGGVPILDEDVTIAEVLRPAGYVCGGFGKWGLGDVGTTGVPEKQGFDVFFGYYHQVHAHSYYPAYLWRNSEKVELPGNAGGKRQQYSHHLIVDEALKFIRDNKDRPFFCYCPWTPPHGMYEIPEDEPAWQLYKDKDWPNDAKTVAAMDSMVDRHVGQVLALLKELGLEDNTIVFFTSDNGAARRFDGVLDSSGPFRAQKGSLYEGGIRVPMIVRWPGRVKPGLTSNLAWYFADVLPTLAELAGVEPPKGIDGISVLPTILGETTVGRKQQEHEIMYWEHGQYDWAKNQPRPGLMQAIRMGKWKAVKPQLTAPIELYDLSQDIGETKNVAAQHPEIVAKLEELFKTSRVDARPQAEPPKPAGQRFA